MESHGDEFVNGPAEVFGPIKAFCQHQGIDYSKIWTMLPLTVTSDLSVYQYAEIESMTSGVEIRRTRSAQALA